jgi:hypothetical protein
MSAQLSQCVFVSAILSALFCRRYFIGAILHCAILSVNRAPQVRSDVMAPSERIPFPDAAGCRLQQLYISAKRMVLSFMARSYGGHLARQNLTVRSQYYASISIM